MLTVLFKYNKMKCTAVVGNLLLDSWTSIAVTTTAACKYLSIRSDFVCNRLPCVCLNVHVFELLQRYIGHAWILPNRIYP